jgi:hypothetical protein
MRSLAIGLALVLPAAAAAGGGHEKLHCTGCHSMHAAKGELLAAVPANLKATDAKTDKPHQPITTLCLACHADPAEGGKGIASVANHLGHPFSRATVNPRLAKVPAELLRDGHFECVGCHDPHPSNPNYRYLRVAGDKSPGMTEFCGICHPRKADPDAVAPRLFSSMDEETRPPGKR